MRASTMLQNDPLQGAVCARCVTAIEPGQRFVPVGGVTEDLADSSRVAHESCERAAVDSAAAALRDALRPSAPEEREFRPLRCPPTEAA